MKKLLALLLLMVIASLSLVSCLFPDEDKAEKLLKKEDYYVEDLDDDEAQPYFRTFKISLPDCDEILMAYDKDTEDDLVIIFYCETKADAKDLEADFNDVLEDEDLEDYVDAIFAKSPEVYRSGKVVCVGSSKAIDILK